MSISGKITLSAPFLINILPCNSDCACATMFFAPNSLTNNVDNIDDSILEPILIITTSYLFKFNLDNSASFLTLASTASVAYLDIFSTVSGSSSTTNTLLPNSNRVLATDDPNLPQPITANDFILYSSSYHYIKVNTNLTNTYIGINILTFIISNIQIQIKNKKFHQELFN